MWEDTHRTLGSVVLPPSQVRPRRSLAVVVLSGVGVGAALMRASKSADARIERSMFRLYDIYKYHRGDYMLKCPFYTPRHPTLAPLHRPWTSREDIRQHTQCLPSSLDYGDASTRVTT